MANFLRRLVKSKSRSKSPQKGTGGSCPSYPQMVEEEELWGGPNKMTEANHIHHHQQHQWRGAGAMDGTKPAVHPNHVSPSPPASRRSPPHPQNRQRPPQFLTQPSPGSIRRPFSAATDEPGTSSQELLSATLWPSSPTPWSLRNSHSNPESAGSGSQRPSTQTTAMLATDEALSSTQNLSQRPRSSSPRKQGPRSVADLPNDRRNFRSRSPTVKKGGSSPKGVKTLDYLQAQCHLEGCSATILVDDTRFLVCKHQLSHASDFFRTLFLNSRALPLEGVRQTGAEEYIVQVSSLRHPPQALQFQWFLETTVPSPLLKDISDNLLETCMRLCKRFAARGLEMRCTRFIQENVESKPTMMALCWLNWAFKHRFHRSVQEACLPVVARLPLLTLEKHRQMVPESVFADLLAMKLRTSYQQASTVFHTIHRMDHFHVDMEKCPRCGRQREQGRVRVQASPCQKMVGCERCMREFGCELEARQATNEVQELQAYWQCEHGLWAFSERTEDCKCQTPLYRANRAGGAEEAVNLAATRIRGASNQTLASKPSSRS